LIDVSGHLTFDGSDLILEAALAGFGLAYLGEHALAPHIASGDLIPVLEDWSPEYPGLSLYFSQRRHMPAKLRAFIELIRERSTGDN
jgi:DNA-binding transcriptional LysR family regulator